MSIIKQAFGTHPDGSTVDRYTLENKQGLRCRIMTLGGIITELWVPDRNGTLADIALGLPTFKEYVDGHPHFGALTGRVAGRINGGTFDLDGKTYQLAINNPPNHLHGGPVGIDKRNWQAEVVDDTLQVTYHSPDGENGYPGNVDITVIYSLTDENELTLTYSAKTDAATPLSLTNHSYFQLCGEGYPSLDSHELQILTDTIVPKDAEGTLSDTPTSVEGTPHDFREPKNLGAFTKGLNHGEHYVLRRDDSKSPELAAVVSETTTGRKMEVLTTATSVQLYTSQTLDDDGVITGKSEKPYVNYSAFCLECQGYPNGVNAPEIDDIILRPGDRYHQVTIYKFSTVPTRS